MAGVLAKKLTIVCWSQEKPSKGIPAASTRLTMPSVLFVCLG